MSKAQKVGEFFKGARQELGKVNWPSRKETAQYTIFVIVFSLILAAFLGLLDMFFIRVLDIVII